MYPRRIVLNYLASGSTLEKDDMYGFYLGDGPRRKYVRRSLNENMEQKAPQEDSKVLDDPLAEQVTIAEF
ncbi:hypothetical protein MTR67_026070 [Solanum verrucosum]|uniref:Uncharacterized protein n=1 Tax=Solanum verrucosum TaxID=315347 RepID=A0AAF0R4S2_SOLVR|nr:hypothetical protein MTR67_026070 [Solanum verrucosum]